MARNSASNAGALRVAIVAGVWLGGVAMTQGAVGSDLGDALRRMEDGIEQQLSPPATLQDPPSRSSEPEPIEPWELVSV
jgi:hypothetical protein